MLFPIAVIQYIKSVSLVLNSFILNMVYRTSMSTCKSQCACVSVLDLGDFMLRIPFLLSEYYRSYDYIVWFPSCRGVQFAMSIRMFRQWSFRFDILYIIVRVVSYKWVIFFLMIFSCAQCIFGMHAYKSLKVAFVFVVFNIKRFFDDTRINNYNRQKSY